ncbi:dTDP-4-dehydrorhamnose reductase [Aciditerrimonas ferrireducens]|uniref:dTDP-4-dehydrorhamnose reductase n=1 Tax=Aciditerrimonas ferrireducens TaxID=667306 RepID=A0ABV6C4U8_9ACTN
MSVRRPLRVLVTGAAGQLGRDLLACLGGELPVGGSEAWLATARLPVCETVGTDLPDLDLTDRSAVRALVATLRPHVVVHGAAWTDVDGCEADPDRAFAVNGLATRHVVEAARMVGARVVYVSTDYVFDGEAEGAYTEWDPPRPRSVYGRSKLAGELELGPGDSLVRTSWVCGAHGRNMVRTVLRLLASGQPLRFVADQRGCPTFTADLAVALAWLVVDGRPGRFHLTNSGATTWHGFVAEILRQLGEDPSRVEAIASAELDPPRPAPRPANSVLDNLAWRASGLPPLPAWQDALARLLSAWRSGRVEWPEVPSPTGAPEAGTGRRG